MIYGYARVSTTEQETTLQVDALKVAGVQRVFQEKRSAVRVRPQLRAVLAALRPGDLLVVWKVDRLARSLKHLLAVLEAVERAGARFRSLTEPIDTSTPMGEFVLQILGAVAQLERSIIRERTVAGQVAAMRLGRAPGRPRTLTADQELEIFELWVVQPRISRAELARRFGVGVDVVRCAILRMVDPDHDDVRQKRPVLGPLLAV